MTTLWTRRLWPYVAALVVLLGLVLSVHAAWRAQEARGYQRAQDEARVVMTNYVNAITPLLAKRDSAVAVTKASEVKVTTAVRDYTTKRAAVPPAVIAADTTVRNALAAADSLAAAAPAFVAAVQTERVITQQIIVMDTSMVHAQAERIAELETENAELRKRPTRTQAVIGVLAGIGLGAGAALLFPFR